MLLPNFFMIKGGKKGRKSVENFLRREENQIKSPLSIFVVCIIQVGHCCYSSLFGTFMHKLAFTPSFSEGQRQMITFEAINVCYFLFRFLDLFKKKRNLKGKIMKYSKFWSVSLEHFIKHKSLTSEEWCWANWME